MRKRTLGGFLMVISTIFLFSMVGPSGAQDMIKIGFFAPITGPAAPTA